MPILLSEGAFAAFLELTLGASRAVLPSEGAFVALFEIVLGVSRACTTF